VIRFFRNLLVTLWLGFLTAAFVESRRSGDLSHVEAAETAPPVKQGEAELFERTEQTIWRRADPVAYTEAEVNRYLAGVITSKQASISNWAGKFDRVMLQFEPDFCRVWFVWKDGDRLSTASLDISIRREKNVFITEIEGGTYGRLPRLPRGLMVILMPAAKSLCKALDDEIHMLFQMNEIHFVKDKVVLDPRFEIVK
jgi:hypothetical protein